MRAAATLAVAVLLAAGCGEAEPERPRGGVAELPKRVPAGVAYRAAEPSAPPAPDFTLELVDGRRVSGASLWRSRPVVLVFLSSWCGPCARQQAALGELVRRYRDVVAFVGIAGQDERPALAEFLDAHEVGYAVGIDESLEIWRRYAVREPPAVVLVARGGRLLRGWPGMVDTRRLEGELAGLVER